MTQNQQNSALPQTIPNQKQSKRSPSNVYVFWDFSTAPILEGTSNPNRFMADIFHYCARLGKLRDFTFYMDRDPKKTPVDIQKVFIPSQKFHLKDVSPDNPADLLLIADIAIAYSDYLSLLPTSTTFHLVLISSSPRLSYILYLLQNRKCQITLITPRITTSSIKLLPRCSSIVTFFDFTPDHPLTIASNMKDDISYPNKYHFKSIHSDVTNLLLYEGIQSPTLTQFESVLSTKYPKFPFSFSILDSFVNEFCQDIDTTFNDENINSIPPNSVPYVKSQLDYDETVPIVSDSTDVTINDTEDKGELVPDQNPIVTQGSTDSSNNEISLVQQQSKSPQSKSRSHKKSHRRKSSKDHSHKHSKTGSKIPDSKNHSSSGQYPQYPMIMQKQASQNRSIPRKNLPVSGPFPQAGTFPTSQMNMATMPQAVQFISPQHQPGIRIAPNQYPVQYQTSSGQTIFVYPQQQFLSQGTVANSLQGNPNLRPQTKSRVSQNPQPIIQNFSRPQSQALPGATGIPINYSQYSNIQPMNHQVQHIQFNTPGSDNQFVALQQYPQLLGSPPPGGFALHPSTNQPVHSMGGHWVLAQNPPPQMRVSPSPETSSFHSLNSGSSQDSRKSGGKHRSRSPRHTRRYPRSSQSTTTTTTSSSENDNQVPPSEST